MKEVLSTFKVALKKLSVETYNTGIYFGVFHSQGLLVLG
jgi:hypothetical protein